MLFDMLIWVRNALIRVTAGTHRAEALDRRLDRVYLDKLFLHLWRRDCQRQAVAPPMQARPSPPRLPDPRSRKSTSQHHMTHPLRHQRLPRPPLPASTHLDWQPWAADRQVHHLAWFGLVPMTSLSSDRCSSGPRPRNCLMGNCTLCVTIQSQSISSIHLTVTIQDTADVDAYIYARITGGGLDVTAP